MISLLEIVLENVVSLVLFFVEIFCKLFRFGVVENSFFRGFWMKICLFVVIGVFGSGWVELKEGKMFLSCKILLLLRI